MAAPRPPTVAVYQDVAGTWRWRLRSRNGRIVAQGEAHGSRRDALRAARSMLASAARAVVVP